MENNLREEKVFDIPKGRVGDFTKKIESLKRRSSKLGCGDIGYEILGEELKVVSSTENEFGEQTSKKVCFLKVRVFGDAPKLNGWLFVAKLEHDEHLGTAVKVLPGQTLPPEYRTRDSKECEHCHKALYRTETFIVRHEDGTYKHVGRQCLADFLGHSSPEDVARYMGYLTEVFSMCDEEYWNDGTRGEIYFPLKQILILTSACIRKLGWVSKSKAAETDSVSTAASVASLLSSQPLPDALKEVVHSVTADDSTLADEVISWASNFSDEQIKESDYLYNINLLAIAEDTNERRLGYACSMVNSYIREKARASESGSFEYAGQVGVRSTFTNLVVSSVSFYEGQFGTGAIYKFRSADGKNIFVWFTSAQELKVDEKVNLTGRVKEHTEWKGMKQTVVTRCAFSKIQ